MANPKLKIYFRGLIAFVPSSIQINGPNGVGPQSMSILLIDATGSNSAPDGSALLPHVPCLRVRQGGVDRRFDLKGYDLDILFDTGGIPNGPILFNKKTDPDFAEFSDIPAMKDVYPQGGLDVNDNCLDYTVKPPSSLAARLQLRNGTFEVVDPTVFPDDFPMHFCDFIAYRNNGSPLPPPTRTNQQVTGTVLFTTELITNHVTIKSKFTPDKFEFTSTGGNLELIFQNVPPYGMRIPDPGFSPDFDFGLVYKIAKQNVDFRYPVKLPSPLPPGTPPPTPRPIMCATALYNSNSKA